MVRIIDKIHARRKEFKLERETRCADDDLHVHPQPHQQQPHQQQYHPPLAEHDIPSHIKNRPQPRKNIINDTTPIQVNGLKSDAIAIQENNNPPPIQQPGWYYSFEFFPPKTEPGLDNLLTRIDRMSLRLDPLFVSITWGANGSTSSRTLAVASHAQRFACVDVLLHLSCTGLTREQIAQVLTVAKSSGIRNILALRGDPPQGKRTWKEGDVSGGECHRAIDLVKLIRKLHGDYFGIAVAGHPEGHPSSGMGEDGQLLELQHLKEKLDAGADFIITQFFFDMTVFLDFVHRCRTSGINCPIIPGIMPIQSYSSLLKMTQFCGISVPSKVIDRLEGVRHDDEAVKKIGCEIATEMCQTILTCDNLDVDGFHFYTLNLERSTTRILAKLGAVNVLSKSNSSSRENLNGDVVAHGRDGNLSSTAEEHGNGTRTRRERKGSESERALCTRRVLPWKVSYASSSSWLFVIMMLC
jgi:methylenetetrahydrofolate reductase